MPYVRTLIDVIATDHAPHTLAEKARSYFEAPSGLPLVQHSLPMLARAAPSGFVQSRDDRREGRPQSCGAFRDRRSGLRSRRLFRRSRRGRSGGDRRASTARKFSTSAVGRRSRVPELHARVALTVVNGAVVCRDGRPLGRPHGTSARVSRPRVKRVLANGADRVLQSSPE